MTAVCEVPSPIQFFPFQNYKRSSVQTILQTKPARLYVLHLYLVTPTCVLRAGMMLKMREVKDLRLGVDEGADIKGKTFDPFEKTIYMIKTRKGVHRCCKTPYFQF